MQMGPYGSMPEPGTRDQEQLRDALAPALAAAARSLQAGAPVQAVLQQVALAGFLIGRGTGPAREPRHEQLLADIRKDLQDEANAITFYTELMNQISDPAVRDYIRHARDDEQKHYRLLGRLYRALSGQSFEARPIPVQFSSLKEGLKKAMDDEYEAFERYREIYLREQERAIRDLYFELMSDELEHATRFNYALQVIT